MVHALALAKLDGVEHQRDIAMLAEPARLSLVGLGDFALGVAAEVENAGERLGDVCGAVDVSGHVGAGNALEVDLLNHVVAPVEGSGDSCLKRRALGHRVQAQHF